MLFETNFMKEALIEAQKAYDLGEIPVGAVVVDRLAKKIVTRAHNLVESEQDPTMHAELIAIRQTCHLISSKNLTNYDLYVTLEPCAMCASAIANARIDRIFYAVNDSKQGAVENGIRFFTSKTCFHRPEIYSNILASESEKIIKSFFVQIRKNSI